MKRAFDFILALSGCLVFLPFVPFVMLAIIIESPGTPIFFQKRVGFKERPFTIFKFRTMMPDTQSVPTHEMKKAELLKTGIFLRKTKIDEIPQLLNVVLGQMSLVGPRPCLLTQDELIIARRNRGVFDIKPGITGLAQVNGIDMSDPEKLAKKDAEYLQDNTFFMDLKLILQTVLPV